MTILALFGALVGCLPPGSWALCVGTQGHFAVESEHSPCSFGDEGSPVSPSTDCATQSCEGCRDYPITVGAGMVVHRSTIDAPAIATIHPTIGSGVSRSHPLLLPPNPSSGSARHDLTTVVLRV